MKRKVSTLVVVFSAAGLLGLVGTREARADETKRRNEPPPQCCQDNKAAIENLTMRIRDLEDSIKPIKTITDDLYPGPGTLRSHHETYTYAKGSGITPILPDFSPKNVFAVLITFQGSWLLPGTHTAPNPSTVAVAKGQSLQTECFFFRLDPSKLFISNPGTNCPDSATFDVIYLFAGVAWPSNP